MPAKPDGPPDSSKQVLAGRFLLPQRRWAMTTKPSATAIFPGLTHMKYSVSPSELVKKFGGSYARELGIDLSHSDNEEIQKWFLAAVLFGARISGKIAAKTYAEFARASVVSSEKILYVG